MLNTRSQINSAKEKKKNLLVDKIDEIVNCKLTTRASTTITVGVNQRYHFRHHHHTDLTQAQSARAGHLHHNEWVLFRDIINIKASTQIVSSFELGVFPRFCIHSGEGILVGISIG